jgi:hypothetical protein
MVRGGPGSHRLRMNESEIEAEIHTLRDGGLLMQASFYFRTFFTYCYMDRCCLACSCLCLDCILLRKIRVVPNSWALYLYL